MNVQPFMNLPVIPSARPLERIPDDRFPMDPYGAQEYLVCLATLIFTGLHLLGWNMSFPTLLEKILWRVSSLVLFCVTAAFWALETMASWVRLGRWRRLYLRALDPDALAQFESAQREKLSQAQPREMKTLPLPWEFWTIAPIAAVYGLARLYQLVGACIELREMDATAFVNVEWSLYWPHI